MEIQSTFAPSSLFEGQTQQGQGTANRDDMFAKMMDSTMERAAERRREQAEAAENARKQPLRADRPRVRHEQPDLATRSRPEPVRAKEPQTERPEPRTASDEVRRPEDRKTEGHKADELKTERRDPPKKEAGAAKDVKPAKDAKAAEETGKAATDRDDAKTETAGDAGADEAVTAADDRDAAGDPTAEEENGATVTVDATVTVTETVVEVITPTSDTILSSLTLETDLTATTAPTGQDDAAPQAAQLAAAQAAALAALQTGTADGNGQESGQGSTQGTAPAAAQPAAKPGAPSTTPQPQDPAAMLVAAQAAQAKQSAGKQAADGAEEAAAGTADTADATGKATEALPTAEDDQALPSSFSDLIAAAKAKMAEKPAGKQAGSEGGRPDGQPAPQQPALAVAPPPVAAEQVKTAAEAQATAALTAADAPAAVQEAGHTAPTNPHAALAAMEAPRAAAPVDATMAAATLRPSRGSAGMPLGVPDQIAVHIKKNVAEDIEQFTINLRPADLGRIDIRLDIGPDGRVSASVAVEKAQTLELLQRDSRGLEKALQDAGLKADSGSLNFSLRGEGNPFQGEGQGGNGSGRRRRGTAGGGGEDDLPDPSAYTMTLGPGRVDIRA